MTIIPQVIFDGPTKFQVIRVRSPKTRNGHGEAMTIVAKVIFDGLDKFQAIQVRSPGFMQMELDIADGTRKFGNRAEFYFYGPKTLKMRNGHGEAMTISSQVIFYGPVGDSGPITQMHADGVSYNIRKSSNRANFQYYGPKIPKMRNDHDELMTIVSQVIFERSKKILGDSGLVAGMHVDGVGYTTQKFRNRAKFLFCGPKTPKHKEQS